MNYKQDILINSELVLLAASTKDKNFKVIDPITSCTLNNFQDDNMTNENLITFMSKMDNFLIQSSSKNILSYYNFSLNKSFHKSSSIDKISALSIFLNNYIIAGTNEGYINIFLANNGNLISKFKNFEKKIIKIQVFE